MGSITRLSLFFCSCLGLTGLASGQFHHKLNAPLVAPGNILGDVTDAALSADGRWAVYIASQDTPGALELYSVALDGSAGPIKLCAPLVEGREVTRVAISPDSRWVAYRADQDQPSLSEVYGVPIDGSAAPVRLNLPVLPNADVGPELSITPGGVVLYKADQRLHAVPVDGRAAALDVSGRMAPDGYVYDFELAPDGKRVVFRARLALSRPLELFSAPIERFDRPATRAAPRPPRVKLSGPLANEDVSDFRISPDGRRVVYQVFGPGHVFSVPIGGGPALQLSGPFPAGGRVNFQDFQISADSSRVVYRADQDVVGRSELYSRPLDASAPASKLNAELVANGDVLGYALSPDASRVVYLADQDTDNVRELYAAPLAGGATPIKLFSAEPNESLTFHPFRISPDSQRVVYLTGTAYGDHQVYRLRSVPLAGDAPALQLNGVHVEFPEEDEEDPQVWDYQISSDGRRVVYLTDEDQDDVFELYSAPIDVGLRPGHVRRAPPVGAVKLNRPLPDHGEVGDAEENAFNFGITADGSQVVYRATQESRDVYELYRVPIDRSAAPVKLNPTLAIGDTPSDVHDFQISPDSARVVYAADQDVDGVPALYSVPSDASAPPVRLDDPQGIDGWVGEFAISADGARVAYLASRNGSVALFGAPIDGSSGPLELSGEMAAGGNVVRFEMAGARVVYLADQERSNLFELFSAPLDGSAAAVRLSGTLVSGGAVQWCIPEFPVVTPDGTRVLYRADQEVDEVHELFSVLVDGSAPPVKLNGPLGATGDVACALISPDGSRVVYPADAGTDGVYELYSVPIDGSAAPRKLNGPFTFERQATVVRITADSTRVLYLADQATINVDELYSVPIDGSAAPVKLNPTLVAGRDVLSDFETSADGLRVVYRADQDQNGRIELYSVPADGSGPAVRLHSVLANDRDILGFAISPDGTRVVYRSNQDVLDEHEIFSVPIDASAPAVQLNAVLIAGGHVRSFEIGPESTHVVYYAKQDSDTMELFRVPILGGLEPQKINAPLVPNGHVMTFRTSPDGKRVIYRADLEVDERIELFATQVVHGRLAARAP